MELKLEKILSGLENAFGQEFFNKMVLNLAEVIDSNYVFIGLVDFNTNSAKTIALCEDGKILENFEYKLKDTPCKSVTENNICYYLDNVADLFPKDQLLRDMGIKGYIGTPLFNSKQEVIGLIVSLTKKPIQSEVLTKSLFQIFSGRVAGELERLEQDQRINLLSMSMKNSSDPIMITDDKAYILDVNPAFEKVYRTDRKTVIGMKARVLYSGVHDIAFYKEMWETLTKLGEWRGEIVNKRLDGTFITVWLSISSVYDEKTQKNSYMAIASDRTEYEKSQAILAQQSKLASMGEMLGSIMHQWKQPLSALQAWHNNIEVKESLNSITVQDYKEAFYSMQTQLKFMVDTITDFQEFLHVDRTKNEFNLYVGFEDIYHLFEFEYKIIELKIENKQNNASEVVGFYNEYKHVILNIINNAKDAYIEKNINDKTLIVSTYDEGQYGVITIEDRAGGISKKVINNIFDPFVSSKESNSGTGIGLYMSKIIIEEHMGGNLSFESVDGGCKFIVKIPLAKA